MEERYKTLTDAQLIAIYDEYAHKNLERINGVGAYTEVQNMYKTDFIKAVQRAIHQQHTKVGDMLFRMCERLEGHALPLIENEFQDVVQWYLGMKEYRAGRAYYEKMEAYNKLTPREREILGVMEPQCETKN